MFKRRFTLATSTEVCAGVSHKFGYVNRMQTLRSGCIRGHDQKGMNTVYPPSIHLYRQTSLSIAPLPRYFEIYSLNNVVRVVPDSIQQSLPEIGGILPQYNVQRRHTSSTNLIRGNSQWLVRNAHADDICMMKPIIRQMQDYQRIRIAACKNNCFVFNAFPSTERTSNDYSYTSGRNVLHYSLPMTEGVNAKNLRVTVYIAGTHVQIHSWNSKLRLALNNIIEFAPNRWLLQSSYKSDCHELAHKCRTITGSELTNQEHPRILNRSQTSQFIRSGFSRTGRGLAPEVAVSSVRRKCAVYAKLRLTRTIGQLTVEDQGNLARDLADVPQPSGVCHYDRIAEARLNEPMLQMWHTGHRRSCHIRSPKQATRPIPRVVAHKVHHEMRHVLEEGYWLGRSRTCVEPTNTLASGAAKRRKEESSGEIARLSGNAQIQNCKWKCANFSHGLEGAEWKPVTGMERRTLLMRNASSNQFSRCSPTAYNGRSGLLRKLWNCLAAFDYYRAIVNESTRQFMKMQIGFLSIVLRFLYLFYAKRRFRNPVNITISRTFAFNMHTQEPFQYGFYSLVCESMRTSKELSRAIYPAVVTHGTSTFRLVHSEISSFPSANLQRTIFIHCAPQSVMSTCYAFPILTSAHFRYYEFTRRLFSENAAQDNAVCRMLFTLPTVVPEETQVTSEISVETICFMHLAMKTDAIVLNVNRNSSSRYAFCICFTRTTFVSQMLIANVPLSTRSVKEEKSSSNLKDFPLELSLNKPVLDCPAEIGI
ncbi:hypothetical protein CLF_112663 [Clonorchis sinensis]|uniref:Uncharacterized protein n=1 Tax=Clonorchis sinensis TaxID=79923 RepID=G7YWR6_CLOSI|nr:hypothetical protein CLF_112663 [Clonorchis sinensis]